MSENSHKFTLYILIALILGIIVGIFAPDVAFHLRYIGLIFTASLKMFIMPLILTTMIAGIASMGDSGKLGTLGKKTVFYYFSTTALAVVVGLVFVNVLEPGKVGLPPSYHQLVKKKDWKSLEKKMNQDFQKKYPTASEKKRTKVISEVLISVKKQQKQAEQLRAELIFADMAMRRSLKVAKALKEKSSKAGNKLSIERFFQLQIKKLFQNPFEAMSRGNVLGVIVFSILFALFLIPLGERAKPLLEMNQVALDVMNSLIQLVIKWMPIGVFSLIGYQIARSGLDILFLLGKYMLCVIIALLVHALIVLPSLLAFLGKTSPWRFFFQVRDALSVAFSTSSSAATLPVSMQVLDKNTDVPSEVSGFVLPLGATVNMDGTALYEAVAAIFIAQLYGIDLSLGQQFIVFLTAALAAIGAAGIPSAGTVTMVMVFTAVGLPLSGIGLILAVDRFLDMCRTTVNVWGDMIGAAILSSKENPQNPGKSNEVASSN